MQASNKSSIPSDPDFNNNLNKLIDVLHEDVTKKKEIQTKEYKSQIGQIAKLASIFINSKFNGNDSSNQLVPTTDFKDILKLANSLKSSFVFEGEEKLLPINPLPINPSSITSTIEVKSLSGENPKMESPSTTTATINSTKLSSQSREQVG